MAESLDLEFGVKMQLGFWYELNLEISELVNRILELRLEMEWVPNNELYSRICIVLNR